MDEFTASATHDWPQSDPYDGLGETEYYRQLASCESDSDPDTAEWRDADELGDPDHERDLALDREFGI